MLETISRPPLAISCLWLVMLQLLWLTPLRVHCGAANTSDACKDASKIPVKYEEFCCGPRDPPANPDTVKAAANEMKLVTRCFELIEGERTKPVPSFPMACCSTRAFGDMCRMEKHNKDKLNKLMRQTVKQTASGALLARSEGQSCDARMKEVCCARPASAMTVLEGERYWPQLSSFFDKLIRCGVEIVQNLARLKFRLPRVCCRLPLLRDFCRWREAHLAKGDEQTSSPASRTKAVASSAPKS